MYQTEFLKQVRKQFGYTIYDMANYLKVTPSFYSQIESKKRKLYYDFAVEIANIFDLKPDEIFLR